MTGKAMFLGLFTCLWLGSLSRPPDVSAHSQIDNAIVVQLGVEAQGTINYDNQIYYYTFDLASDQKVSMQFLHQDVNSSYVGWEIRLMDDYISHFYTQSFPNDRGVTCSLGLTQGKYYLMVKGHLTDLPPGTPFSLTVSLQDVNVRVLDALTGTSYSTLDEAFSKAVPDCRIQSKSLTHVGDVIFDKDITVSIEGGKDNCFYEDTGYTTIRGTVKVRDGKLTVSRLILN